jgi:hypothetical protein
MANSFDHLGEEGASMGGHNIQHQAYQSLASIYLAMSGSRLHLQQLSLSLISYLSVMHPSRLVLHLFITSVDTVQS